MPNSGSVTFFTNEGNSQPGTGSYVSDVFTDVSLPATNNTGFSSTLGKNPLSAYFGNDDVPRYGPKTLIIRDLVLVDDRSKWINGEPTYLVIFEESFPAVVAYVWGTVQIVRNFDQTHVLVRKQTDGFGVSGVFRKVQFIVNQDLANTATGTVQVDGAGATQIDYSSLSSQESSQGRVNRLSSFVHAASNETYDIHDFRLIANEVSTLRIVGVVVYSENAGANLDLFPGTTYNNKNKLTTTVGATLPLPTYGSTLGGRAAIFKAASDTYGVSGVPAQMLATVGTGTNGSNLITVTTGTGASYPAGTGFVTSFGGASFYIGMVTSVSTDTLTVNPPLPFGVSGPLYKYFAAGQSLPISATLNFLAYTFGQTQMSGFTLSYLKPDGKVAVWGNNIGMTAIDGVIPTIAFATATGAIQVDGYFSAAEVEFFGCSFSVLSGRINVNGATAYMLNNIGVTGFIKKTMFTDAGPGWNSFSFNPGSSHTNVNISRINLYRRDRDQGVTFGALAEFDTLQGYVERAVNATLVAPGTYQRYFADQLPFKDGAWVRATGTNVSGPAQYGYAGGATISSIRFEYYGKNFAVLGAAGSLLMSIDGVSTSSTFNTMKVVASEGFHVIGITTVSGQSAVIAGIDITRTVGELKNVQNYLPRPELKYIPIPDDGQSYFEAGFVPNNFGTVTAYWANVQRIGNWAEVLVNFTTGTNSAATASISLPSNMSIDSDELLKGLDTVLGTYVDTTSSTTTIYTGGYAGFIFFDGSDTSKVYITRTMGTVSGRMVKEVATAGFDNTQPAMFKFRVPISGWSRKRR